MKTIIPFIPLYLFTFIALVLLLKSFINAIFPPKVKNNDLGITQDQKENTKLYELFC